MSEKYTGQALDRRYSGAEGDITYNLRRCIHAEQCVHRLAQVFDPSKRPWINADAADTEAIQQVIPACPSGALHFLPKTGAGEAVPAENTVRLWTDGPLQLTGDLAITGATVEIESETRATLCRCGGSQNKPFCDNTHKTNGFQAGSPADALTELRAEQGGKLRITAEPNGPLHVEGNFQIVNAEGVVIAGGDEAWLCRCGGSGNKPFCDSTHVKIGFQAE
jgi:CDGSH-type Zn-finger protein/uncharacterized Fe-S cluster protein YjdI